jgi:hypothetical protein
MRALLGLRSKLNALAGQISEVAYFLETGGGKVPATCSLMKKLRHARRQQSQKS